jgi:3D (Asp-Asp-Asp) domain-containing protein
MSNGFGKGVNNYWLHPYKSIAVDKLIIPIGSVIFIPQALGIKYKDSSGRMVEHDGHFFAADVGSEIVGNHIDIFLGIGQENPFGFVASNQDITFEAFIIDDSAKEKELMDLHKKP